MTFEALVPPAELFGELFHEVQIRRLFPDGKQFVDMEPRQHPATIMSNYQRLRSNDHQTLAEFVFEHFAPPPATASMMHNLRGRQALLDHIRATWDDLSRQPVAVPCFSSALALPAPYLVPGGRFRELYYWDSYFTMLGLKADGRYDLIEATIENCTALIERFGYMPNGSRTYYLGRSQPPVYYLMLELSHVPCESARKRRLDALLLEHSFWMTDSTFLRPGEASRRAVCMPDGSILNRYWDERERPRDESYAEDLTMARQNGREPSSVFRNLRAAAESGWDFSSRWYEDSLGAGSIRTTSIAPIDLNCLLFGLERSVMAQATELEEQAIALRFKGLAERRYCALHRYCWSNEHERFGDVLWSTGCMTSSINSAALFPLFTGLARARQADAMAALVKRELLAPGGIRTTTVRSGEQWDLPNGWAPLQWIAAAGLIRYGHGILARDIARRWVSVVGGDYSKFGIVFEKYDVESRTRGSGGEYPVQTGFGWTNGVVRAFMRDDAFGCETPANDGTE